MVALRNNPVTVTLKDWTPVLERWMKDSVAVMRNIGVITTAHGLPACAATPIMPPVAPKKNITYSATAHWILRKSMLRMWSTINSNSMNEITRPNHTK